MRAVAIPLAGVLLLALGGLLHQQTRTYLEVVQLREKLAAANSRATTAEETLALKHSALSEATAEIARVTHEASVAKAAVAKAAAHRCNATTKAGPSQALPPTVEYVHESAADFAPAGTLVMTTYATGGVQEMLRNWVLHVQRLQSPLLVCAMDAAIVRQCREQGFHCLDWSQRQVAGQGEFGDYVRGNELGFRLLGVRKIDALLSILGSGLHIVLSDVDCVWSADPLPFVLGQRHGYASLAHADVLVATDCMQPEADFGRGGCFFESVDKNTGVIAVRASVDGVRAMREWRVRMAIGQKNEQDQTVFMDMLDGNGRGHRWGLSGAQRTQWCHFAAQWCGMPTSCHGGLHTGQSRFVRHANLRAAGVGGTKQRTLYDVCLPNISRALKVGIFPTTEISGGHTFFVQNYHTSTGRWPRAVHATYQFGDATDYPFGKRQRFRDWGLWLADDEAEMIGTPGSARYLVLEDNEPLAPAAPLPVDRRNASQLLARGRQHVAHLERTRQRLAHGVALARALNRTLVLPPLWCYCDKFWSRLADCAIPEAASSQPLPFACPMDHVVELQYWHGEVAWRSRRPRPGMLAARADGPWQDGMPYRSHYWLRQLGAHPGIGMSSATLTLDRNHLDARRIKVPPQLLDLAAEELPLQRHGLGHEVVAGEAGPRLVVPQGGLSDAELRGALRPYEHVALLRVATHQAGQVLRCIEEPKDAQALSSLTHLLFKHDWCYRPQEMTSAWYEVERGPKPRRGTEPWCSWGFADPAVPGVCAASGGASEQK